LIRFLGYNCGRISAFNSNVGVYFRAQRYAFWNSITKGCRKLIDILKGILLSGLNKPTPEVSGGRNN
jgi:hypothetical protein